MPRLADFSGKVDLGIITIKEEEFTAVLQRFPPQTRLTGKREYNLARVATERGEYLVAIVRCLEQGTGEAQDVARDLLDDLEPQWLLVVGIAGAVPNEDASLGDVVVMSRVLDFTVEALLQDGSSEYAVAGGPLAKPAASLVANLPAMNLVGWNDPAAVGAVRPPVPSDPDAFFGGDAWQAKVRRAIGKLGAAPRAVAGAVASSDRLIKDTEILSVWQKLARQVVCVEMEAAGVFRASRSRSPEVPVLVVRGLSDVVGLNRDASWTTYACHSAASYARALVAAGPFEPRQQPNAQNRAPVSGNELIALGPDVLAHGRLVGAEGAVWHLELEQPFVLGDVYDLARLGESFTELPRSERYVAMERRGEARLLAGPPKWSHAGDACAVELRVEPPKEGLRAAALGADLPLTLDTVPFDVKLDGTLIKGLAVVRQRLTTGLSMCKGGWGIDNEFGSRVAEFHALFGRDPIASLIKVEIARMSVVPIRDTLLGGEVAPFDFVHRVLDVTLESDIAPGWLRARVRLLLHGEKSPWEGLVNICLSTRELTTAPPQLPLNIDP